jgi:sugar O-acyltransferase (sialic acid O-acetyltransferase NeuD family)
MRCAESSESLAILGSGPLAREFAMWCFDAGVDRVVFVNDLPEAEDGEMVGGRHVKVLRDWSKPHRFIVGIGNPRIKGLMVTKALLAGWVANESVVHPSAVVRSELGMGGLIAPNCVVTCDVMMGNYVTVNLNCTIGHDTRMGSYSTLNPGVHVSGNCDLGVFVEVGTGAVIRDGIHICANVKIGAGSAVVKNITESGIYVGVPCGRLK